jgi:hypothetical protein
MRKTIDDHKHELIEALVSARRSILDEVASLPFERLDEVFLGVWSVKDLLAHLVGWDHTNLQAVQEIVAGEPPAFFRNYDKDWQSYNARLVQEYKTEPFDVLLAEITDSHQFLVGYLASLPAKMLVEGKVRNEKGRTITIRNLLRVEASDERIHAEQIKAFISTKLKS